VRLDIEYIAHWSRWLKHPALFSIHHQDNTPMDRREQVKTRPASDWDWLFRFWDARCNTATQSEYVAVFGKRIIADSLKKGRWDNGYVSALERDGPNDLDC
jgi:hypothetical protein